MYDAGEVSDECVVYDVIVTSRYNLKVLLVSLQVIFALHLISQRYLHSVRKVKYSVKCLHSWLPRSRKNESR